MSERATAIDREVDCVLPCPFLKRPPIPNVPPLCRPLKVDMMAQASMDAAVARVREEAAGEGLPVVGLVNNAGGWSL
jgi:NAD(P)-dependent dehydrogenase (short-subunit alcohol dehydrogenase family)